ncbi:hypothetical protein BDN70DRAFT_876659 [Pholiota conissans]|uniref:HTH CENPB-type domain-containing protein n=1 Tax=Pholiota conissans TaxID=109636 RepID=A0A9P5Z512_9AGAR|nr:hypothetical protein BDN70DRAFT_876659 [Pholiota conissans]
MDPAHVLVPAHHHWFFDMSQQPYPSPAPDDIFHLPASGPARRRLPDSYNLPAPYPAYDLPRHRSRPRSMSVLEPLRGPSPSRSTASDDDRSHHGGPPSSASPVTSSSAPRLSVSSAPTPPRREPPKHTKHRLRDSDRKAICQFHIDHPQMRQEDIGAEFNVERSTISKILKEKARWLNISPEDESNEQTSRHRPSKFPEIEWEMRQTLQIWSEQGVNITDNIIRKRALEIARSHDISADRFKGSSGWVENFKARHNIRRGEYCDAEVLGPISRSGVAPLLKPPPGSHQARAQAQQRQQQQQQNQSMGMGMNYAQSHHQQHQQHWQHSPDSGSGDSSPGAGSSNLVLDPTLQNNAQSGQGGAHTPVQSQLALDPSAIQHSPEGYDSSQYGQPLPSHHHHLMNQPYTNPGPTITTSIEPRMAGVQHTVCSQGADGELISMAVVGENPPPTLQEAEDAMTLVIRYLDACAPNLVTPDEREAMTHVKCALFQHANGMPYVRHS